MAKGGNLGRGFGRAKGEISRVMVMVVVMVMVIVIVTMTVLQLSILTSYECPSL
jgi:hypothetical protein